MSNLDLDALASDNGEHPLGPARNWQGAEILHCVVNIAMPDGQLEFFYDPQPPGAIQGMSIQDFIDSLTQVPFALRSANFLRDPPKGPLDFKTDKACYVVFELHDGHNWQFRPDGDAVTTKLDKAQTYFGLQHVVPGQPVPLPGGVGGPDDGCKIVWFCAELIQPWSDDYFNLYIEFIQQDDRRVPVRIDPDIKNNGGNPTLRANPPVGVLEGVNRT